MKLFPHFSPLGDSPTAPVRMFAGVPWRSVALIAGLVALGVAGRCWQPAWNVTPMAGIALVAGASLRNRAVALAVPLAALALSNLGLPGYESPVMAAVVYAATAWPVLLGPLLRGGRLPPLVGGAVASSLVFFLTTNFAHWLLTTDYPRTAAGLAECYLMALPFYRWMPVGDLVWTVGLFALVPRLLTGGLPATAGRGASAA